MISFELLYSSIVGNSQHFHKGAEEKNLPGFVMIILGMKEVMEGVILI